jgi:hypothetical protein
MTGSRLDSIGGRLVAGEGISLRRETISTLCDLILEKGAVFLWASSQSGKTSMLDLIMRLPEGRCFRHILYISLASLSGSTTFDQIWERDVRTDLSFSDL